MFFVCTCVLLCSTLICDNGNRNIKRNIKTINGKNYYIRTAPEIYFVKLKREYTLIDSSVSQNSQKHII